MIDVSFTAKGSREVHHRRALSESPIGRLAIEQVRLSRTATDRRDRLTASVAERATTNGVSIAKLLSPCRRTHSWSPRHRPFDDAVDVLG